VQFASTRPADLSAPIGGFFEAFEPPAATVGLSLLDAWTAGRPFAAFVTARAAFAALAARVPDAALWLPAFICADLVGEALRPRARFYPVQDGFIPHLAPVGCEARPGDVILAVAHFGLPVAESVRAFAESRRDLVFVEDRAQALGPGLGELGGWTLYSPRKLLGVADGGLLVAPSAHHQPPQPTTAPDSEALWRAPLLRRDDPMGRANTIWHAANQAKEGALDARPAAMTARTRAILATTDWASLAAPRMANWRRLDAGLARWSALPAAPSAPPLGYVLRLDPDQRTRLLSRLHAERIFAAVHWPQIAAPARDYPREARWTRELVTLPCDHRYGPHEMDRIRDLTLQALQ
jgi:hypothetical protein